jgi:hypothetical protein
VGPHSISTSGIKKRTGQRNVSVNVGVMGEEVLKGGVSLGMARTVGIHLSADPADPFISFLFSSLNTRGGGASRGLLHFLPSCSLVFNHRLSPSLILSPYFPLWGVWLGRLVRERIAHASKEQLREDGNLS